MVAPVVSSADDPANNLQLPHCPASAATHRREQAELARSPAFGRPGRYLTPELDCSFRPLHSTSSPATLRTPLAYEWIFRSTFGYQRSRSRDRVFAHWALANGVLADGIFANRRGGGGNRLRPWHVGSNCCSHESQRSDTKDYKSQHRVLTMVRVCWNSPDTRRNNPTLATTAMNRPRRRQ